MTATICPSQETLLQYSLGTLPEEEWEALDRHLEGCPECQATMVTLDEAGDTVIARLPLSASDEALLAEPQLQAALAAALAIPAPTAEGGSASAELPRGGLPESLGEYRLLEELGRGGMGRVYKALHTKLDRVVAVKVLSRGRVGDQQALVRFEREMKAVGRLAHPNIVQAHDAREIDGTPVLIMEYVDGLDLAQIVRRVGPLSVAAACELIRQTSLALQCAHEHGLVHRDIKPSNIMLARSGEVKLLDLGLARFYAEGPAGLSSAGEEMTGTGQAMGTADYMAPEQASDSRTVDIRADLYSLGCTLYRLLSGRAPFSGPEHRGTLDKLNAQVHQQPPFIRRLVPDVPEGLAAILDRLLAKDPNDRFATPAEVAEALAPWCEGADLPALLQRAIEAKSSPLPPGDGQGEGRVAGQALPAARPPLLLTSWGWKWLAGQLTLLLLVGGLGFALGLVIHIRKDGRTYKIEVPEGSSTMIDGNGNPTVTLAEKSADGNAPAPSSAAEPPRGQKPILPARVLRPGPHATVKEYTTVRNEEVHGYTVVVGSGPRSAKDSGQADKDDAALIADLKEAGHDGGRVGRALRPIKERIPKARNDAWAKVIAAALAENSSTFTRKDAAEALGNWGTRESIPALTKAAKSSDVFLAGAAKQALRKIADDLGIPKEAIAREPWEKDVNMLLADLKEAGSDQHRLSPVLRELSQRLAKTPNAAVTKALETVLADNSNINICAAACSALAHWGTPDSIPALKKAAASSDRRLADAAQRAIAEISSHPNKGEHP